MRHGIPKTVDSHNAPQLAGAEFKAFVQIEWEFKNVTPHAYHSIEALKLLQKHIRSSSKRLKPLVEMSNMFYSSMYSTITTPFNNMRTLKFKAQPTNAFFAAAYQVLGQNYFSLIGSSLPPTTGKHCFVV